MQGGGLVSVRMTETASRNVKVAAAVALVSVAFFVIATVVMHFIRPDYNPIRLPTTFYAVGRYGILMTAAFLSMSVATWALFTGLRSGVPKSAQSRVGLVLLGIWGVGALIVTIFPTDLEGVPTTVAGTIHRINGALSFLSVGLGVTLISWNFRRDDGWRSLHPLAFVLGLIVLAGFVAVPLTFVTGVPIGGLVQRIVLATIVIWFVLVAQRLLSRET
jgi:hypothetical protein